MTDIQLLDKVDKQQLIDIELAKKNFKFPANIVSEHAKNVYITEKLLRKYHTLVEDLYKQDGQTNAKAKTAGRLLVSRRILGRKAQSSLIRKRLTQMDEGKMFTFMYDPKHKKTLPYYDRLPVIVPFDVTPKGFTALNFHHIPPAFRLHLLKQLQRYKISKDLRTRFRIRYDIMERSKKFRFAMPIIRSYLYTHLKSPIITIPESDWNLMLILPSPQMIGLNEKIVWQQNRKAALRI